LQRSPSKTVSRSKSKKNGAGNQGYLLPVLEDIGSHRTANNGEYSFLTILLGRFLQ
jgi:hypothetical protein